jgi:hypothetical protein
MKKIKNAEESGAQTMQKAIEEVHAYATTLMQGLIGSFPSPTQSKDVIEFAKDSSSVIVRTKNHANIYMAFHQSDVGNWSAVVGAAQGLHQEWNAEKLEFTEIKESLPVYRTEALYQLAQTIVAQQTVQTLNEKEATNPLVILVGNYMSRSNTARSINFEVTAGSNNDAVDIRSKIINDISKNGLQPQALKQLNVFITELNGKVLDSSVRIGGNKPTISVCFTQQGVNTARHYSKAADAAPLLTIAQKINENTAVSEGPKSLNNLIKAIQASEQTSKNTRFWARVWAVILSVMIGKVVVNEELHCEALKIVLVQKMGGAVVGGRQSAKDRFGALRLTALTIQEYMEKKGGAVPPAFGSKAYKQMAEEDRAVLRACS